MVTIKQLQRDIARERKKLGKVRGKETLEIEKSKLKKELFMIQHQKAIAGAGKGARLLRKAGRGILKAGKKAAPVIIKQGRLIREQQLRDDAIARKLAKTKKPKPKKQPQGFGVFGNLDF